MFVTTDGVTALTGYEVTNAVIAQAQAIVESYVGRMEAEVTNAGDKMLLERATAYQAAYMNQDTANVFEQVGAVQVQQFGQMITFSPDGAAPFIAPLAVLACRKLSWRRMRSIKTGSIYYSGPSGTYSEYWRTV